MSNYNDNSSWSDKFSWIITVIALVLVAILSIGLLCALFIQPNEEKPDEQTEVQQATVIDGEGNAMMSGTTYAMPARMVFATTAAEVSNASEGITLTATIQPETGMWRSSIPPRLGQAGKTFRIM